MSQSALATCTRLSPNCTAPRQGAISGVAIHCTAGSQNNTATQIVSGQRFITKSKNGASCHYAVGGDGSIAQGCLEENRAWCTSNPIDHNLITIEVASDTTGIRVNEKAIDALIVLLADICQRNSIPRLLWKGQKSLMGQWDVQNMVVHRWTANKACPGDTLYARHGEIAERVNALLTQTKTPVQGQEEDDMTKEQTTELIQEKLAQISPVYNSVAECPDWARATVQKLIGKGAINGELEGRLNLSYDLLRILVVNDRAGIYG